MCPDSDRPVRLLVIVNHYLPDAAGGAAIFGDMCEYLSENGFEVTVRCPYPHYPEWKDKSGKNGLKIGVSIENSVRVERHGLFIPRNPRSLIQRLFYEASIFISLLRQLPTFRKYDVVMAFCPNVAAVASSSLGCRIFRKPLWLNVQDLAAEAASDVGLVKRAWITRILKYIQRSFFNQAAVWSTISPSMAERLVGARKHDQPLLLLPNWAGQSITEKLSLHKKSSQARIRKRVRLLYSGNIGIKQQLPELLKSLSQSALDFEFKIHGDGAGARAVRDWISAASDPRFRMGPLLDESAFAEALSRTDFFVITETQEGQGAFMPSKLVTGLAAGKPMLVISSPESPLGREVIEQDLGPHFTWDEVSGVARCLESTCGEANEQYLTWCNNSTNRFKHYDRNLILGRLGTGLRTLSRGELPTGDY